MNTPQPDPNCPGCSELENAPSERDRIARDLLSIQERFRKHDEELTRLRQELLLARQAIVPTEKEIVATQRKTMERLMEYRDLLTLEKQALEKHLKAALDKIQAMQKELEAAQKAFAHKPKIVCICGSSRFVDMMAVEAWNLEKQGVIVLSPHLLPQWYDGVREHHQAEAEGVTDVLDKLHLRKIDMADEVLVVNVNGYIGERTKIEIGYAKSQRKPITYLEHL